MANHIISALSDKSYITFGSDAGKSPFNYVLEKPHDAWRTFLPYLINYAKTNTTSFSSENVVAWYRQHPKNACGTGGTTGNTASQLQQVYSPGEMAEDAVFFAALLSSSATVSVSIGGVASTVTWIHAPSNGVGLSLHDYSFEIRCSNFDGYWECN
ncbi:hypothetical protein IFR05_010943 [Cadophora sp. M221]|nr:hypothetical protein IFR05_010943 [Cadophora sp. M221]